MSPQKKEAIEFCLNKYLLNKMVDIWLTVILTLGLALIIFPIFGYLIYKYYKAKKEVLLLKEELSNNPDSFDGSYLKWIRGISTNKLLILDDFGLKALSNDARIALLDILEDRYGNGSTIITSQLPIDSWYNFIDEPTLADAIMDRLSASAHRITLAGQSLRKKKNP